jgi:hypothetical protein
MWWPRISNLGAKEVEWQKRYQVCRWKNQIFISFLPHIVQLAEQNQLTNANDLCFRTGRLLDNTCRM